MYVFGGDDGTISNPSKKNDMEIGFDNNTTDMELVAKNGTKTPARAGHSAIVYNGKMYVFGGDDGSTKYNDVWKLDLGTKTWTQVTQVAGAIEPSARIGHSAVVHSGSMYVFGGTGSPKRNDTFQFDLVKNEWSAIVDNLPITETKITRWTQESAIVTNKDNEDYVVRTNNNYITSMNPVKYMK